jgi:hypothetical protein
MGGINHDLGAHLGAHLPCFKNGPSIHAGCGSLYEFSPGTTDTQRKKAADFSGFFTFLPGCTARHL